MHEHSKSTRLQANPERDTFITFHEVVKHVREYVETTAESLRKSRPTRDSQVGQRLLFETLSSTRLRAKNSLDALVQSSRSSSAGSRQMQYSAISGMLHRVQSQIEEEGDTERLLNWTWEVDKELQRAIENQLGSDSDLEEDLGQLLTIITMMRRACSLILTTERDAG